MRVHGDRTTRSGGSRTGAEPVAAAPACAILGLLIACPGHRRRRAPASCGHDRPRRGARGCVLIAVLGRRRRRSRTLGGARAGRGHAGHGPSGARRRGPLRLHPADRAGQCEPHRRHPAPAHRRGRDAGPRSVAARPPRPASGGGLVQARPGAARRPRDSLRCVGLRHLAGAARPGLPDRRGLAHRALSLLPATDRRNSGRAASRRRRVCQPRRTAPPATSQMVGGSVCAVGRRGGHGRRRSLQRRAPADRYGGRHQFLPSRPVDRARRYRDTRIRGRHDARAQSPARARGWPSSSLPPSSSGRSPSASSHGRIWRGAAHGACRWTPARRWRWR